MAVKSRIVLFVFYDPSGNVDDYVGEILKSIRTCCERLVVIVNGYVSDKGFERLKSLSDDILTRPNTGYDAGALKECMTEYLGWEEVQKYDELVLMNDTFYGPINDTFRNIFGTMEEKDDIDFWGLSCGYKQVDSRDVFPDGVMPEHIQSFFIVLRNRVICSDAFTGFWDMLETSFKDLTSAICNYELRITKHLSDNGFRWATYADTEDFNSPHIRKNYNIYGYNASELLRYHRFPFVKRKNFCADLSDLLYMRDLEDIADAYDYIHEKSDYDTGLIWQNLLHRYNTMSLYQTMHLNYILSSENAGAGRITNAALIYYCSNPDCLARIARSAIENSSLLDVYFMLDGEGELGELKGSSVQIIEPTGILQSMGGFVLGCREIAKKYTYLGFVHDENNQEHLPNTIYDSVAYNYIQNIANDPAYITQVISVFEKNANLGVLAAPMPIHNKFISCMSNSWQGKYQSVKKLVKELGLHCILDPDVPPLMISGAFWCRTDAIEDLWKSQTSAASFSSRTNEVLKCILPFAAQSRGYYSGIVMHNHYASLRLDTEEYLLRMVVDVKGETYLGFSDYYKRFDEKRSYNTIDAQGNKILYRDLGVRGAFGIYIKKHFPGKVAGFLVRLFRLY